MFSLDIFERFCAASHSSMPKDIQEVALDNALSILDSVDETTLKFNCELISKFVFHSGHPLLAKSLWEKIKDQDLKPRSLYSFEAWDGEDIDIHAAKIFLHLSGENLDNGAKVVYNMLLSQSNSVRRMKIIGCIAATQPLGFLQQDPVQFRKAKQNYYPKRLSLKSNHPAILFLDDIFIDRNIEAWKDAFVEVGRSIHTIPNMVDILDFATAAQIINGIKVCQEYKNRILVQIQSAHQAVDMVGQALTLTQTDTLERAKKAYDIMSAWEKNHA